MVGTRLAGRTPQLADTPAPSADSSRAPAHAPLRQGEARVFGDRLVVVRECRVPLSEAVVLLAAEEFLERGSIHHPTTPGALRLWVARGRAGSSSCVRPSRPAPRSGPPARRLRTPVGRRRSNIQERGPKGGRVRPRLSKLPNKTNPAPVALPRAVADARSARPCQRRRTSSGRPCAAGLCHRGHSRERRPDPRAKAVATGRGHRTARRPRRWDRDVPPARGGSRNIGRPPARLPRRLRRPTGRSVANRSGGSRPVTANVVASFAAVASSPARTEASAKRSAGARASALAITCSTPQARPAPPACVAGARSCGARRWPERSVRCRASRR